MSSAPQGITNAHETRGVELKKVICEKSSWLGKDADEKVWKQVERGYMDLKYMYIYISCEREWRSIHTPDPSIHSLYFIPIPSRVYQTFRLHSLHFLRPLQSQSSSLLFPMSTTTRRRNTVVLFTITPQSSIP